MRWILVVLLLAGGVQLTPAPVDGIAVIRGDALIVVDPASGAHTDLIACPAESCYWPVWSADRQRIGFVSAEAAYIYDLVSEGLSAQPVDFGVYRAQLAAGTPVLSWSSDLSRLAYSGRFDMEQRLIVLEMASGALIDAGGGTMPQLSPDGSRLAYLADGVEVVDLASGAITRVEIEGGIADWPVWSPDGGRIAYRLRQADRWALGVIDLLTGATRVYDVGLFDSPVWSPDGDWVVVNRWPSAPAGRLDLLAIPLEGGTPVILAENALSLLPASWSADSQRLAYVGGLESGATGLYTVTLSRRVRWLLSLSQRPTPPDWG